MMTDHLPGVRSMIHDYGKMKGSYMVEDKKEEKIRKKEFHKAQRSAVRPWRGLTIFSASALVIMIPILVILSMYDSTVAAFMGDDFWKLKNEDENAVYFDSDFASAEEMSDYGLDVCRQVEAEGAVLLLNENNALPLKDGANVSCFSSSSVNLAYGGGGSGNIDASKADSLKTAMEKSGLHVNDILWEFYSEGEGGVDSLSGARITEVPWNVYPEAVKDSVAAYGDAAVVVLSRVGGEGGGLEYRSTNYLALNEDEKEMLQNLAVMKDGGTIEKIIVLIHSANALQLDFLQDNEYGVDACLWIGNVGVSGINAATDILAGKVNPSGSLADTWCYQNDSSPAMVNSTPAVYDGYEEGMIPENASAYMVYQEGIYVGYKYYETRYEDYVMGAGNPGDYAYGADVAFPFGHGLSYTDFTYSDITVCFNNTTDQFEITVKVTNTGDLYSGKETVQIYSQSPYSEYDVNFGVEKASAVLCGFAKTGILKPGDSETLSIYVNKRDIASYDAYGMGTYILEAGDYYLTAATDAHDAVNNFLAVKGFSPENTDGRMDAEGNTDLVYWWRQEEFDSDIYAVSANGTEIKNQLSDADINLYEDGENRITYLSRNDWSGTFPKESARLKLTAGLIADLNDNRYDPADYPEVEMPVLEADNGLKLYDMIGLPYEDERWEPLLDQLTFREMVSLIDGAFHRTMPVLSVQAPGTRDENTTQGLSASLSGSGAARPDATAFTSADVMAATFNTALMTEIGRVIGNYCLKAGISCLYGPGNNIHRTPYGEKNFENYSEDGFLSGKMSAYEVAAIQEKGIHVMMKHFALNDSEQDGAVGVWLNEQAAREIYLKAFQTPVEEGNANGVVIADTRWGCAWPGGCRGLVTGILRKEWGCDGMVIADNVLSEHGNGVDGILAGVSIYDAMTPYVTNQLSKYKKDPVIVSAMKEACHHNLYAIANSAGMNRMGADTTVQKTGPVVITVLRTAVAAAVILFAVSLFLWMTGRLRRLPVPAKKLRGQPAAEKGCRDSQKQPGKHVGGVMDVQIKP